MRVRLQDTALTMHGCGPETNKQLFASNLTGGGKTAKGEKDAPQKKVYDINDQVKVVAKWWKELQMVDLEDQKAADNTNCMERP